MTHPTGFSFLSHNLVHRQTMESACKLIFDLNTRSSFKQLESFIYENYFIDSENEETEQLLWSILDRVVIDYALPALNEKHPYGNMNDADIAVLANETTREFLRVMREAYDIYVTGDLARRGELPFAGYWPAGAGRILTALAQIEARLPDPQVPGSAAHEEMMRQLGEDDLDEYVMPLENDLPQKL